MMLFTLVGMFSKVLLVFSAVLWHEVAHAAMALLLGCKVREIELLPFGGVARIEGLGTISAKTEMLIAAAGPAASLLLAALVYAGISYTSTWPDMGDFYVKTNIMLALFNLVPGLPLDGGRILRAWLTLHMEYGKATLVAARISKIVSMTFLLILVYDYLSKSTVNVTFLLAAVFLYTTAKSEIKIAGFRTLRILGQKKAQLIAKGIMTTAYFTVVNTVIIKDVIGLFTPDQYSVVVVIDKECKLCGTLTEIEIWEKIISKGIYTRVGEFL